MSEEENSLTSEAYVRFGIQVVYNRCIRIVSLGRVCALYRELNDAYKFRKSFVGRMEKNF